MRKPDCYSARDWVLLKLARHPPELAADAEWLLERCNALTGAGADGVFDLLCRYGLFTEATHLVFLTKGAQQLGREKLFAAEQRVKARKRSQREPTVKQIVIRLLKRVRREAGGARPLSTERKAIMAAATEAGFELTATEVQRAHPDPQKRPYTKRSAKWRESERWQAKPRSGRPARKSLTRST
jgi:hypothetical protein